MRLCWLCEKFVRSQSRPAENSRAACLQAVQVVATPKNGPSDNFTEAKMAASGNGQACAGMVSLKETMPRLEFDSRWLDVSN